MWDIDMGYTYGICIWDIGHSMGYKERDIRDI